jgi:hypothetical protein
MTFAAKFPEESDEVGACTHRMKDVLNHGVEIGGRHFEFLAFSSSQLKEQSCWLFAGRPGLSADNIRSFMGDFSNIRCIAKAGARMGQCFSTTVEALRLQVKSAFCSPSLARVTYPFCLVFGGAGMFVYHLYMAIHGMFVYHLWQCMAIGVHVWKEFWGLLLSPHECVAVLCLHMIVSLWTGGCVWHMCVHQFDCVIPIARYSFQTSGFLWSVRPAIMVCRYMRWIRSRTLRDTIYPTGKCTVSLMGSAVCPRT